MSEAKMLTLRIPYWWIPKIDSAAKTKDMNRSAFARMAIAKEAGIVPDLPPELLNPPKKDGPPSTANHSRDKLLGKDKEEKVRSVAEINQVKNVIQRAPRPKRKSGLTLPNLPKNETDLPNPPPKPPPKPQVPSSPQKKGRSAKKSTKKKAKKGGKKKKESSKKRVQQIAKEAGWSKPVVEDEQTAELIIRTKENIEAAKGLVLSKLAGYPKEVVEAFEFFTHRLSANAWAARASVLMGWHEFSDKHITAAVKAWNKDGRPTGMGSDEIYSRASTFEMAE